MEDIKHKVSNISVTRFASLILDIGTILLESGAHCERISRNINRIASKTPYDVQILMTFTGISVTVIDKNNNQNIVTENRRLSHHGAHFGVLTETSLLTWRFFEEELSINELEKSLKKLKYCKRYNVWVVRLFIGIACACLCLLGGGNYVDASYTFMASFIGLLVRQEMIRFRFNLMVSITCSALITTSIAGINVLNNAGVSPQASVATAVLFLIPGVPLINCIIDLLEGYIPIGLARGVFGGFILLCIAVGMFLSMNILGVNKF